MSARVRWALVLVVALVLGALVLLRVRACHDAIEPLIQGTIDTLPDQPMADERPADRPRSLGQRITTTRIPSHVSVSVGQPDSALVMRFAHLALEADSLRRVVADLRARRAAGDTSAHPELVPRAKAVLPTVAGKYDGRTVKLWLTRSDGSLLRATARLRPHWSFYSGFDHGSDTLPVFTGDRFWLRLGRQLVHCTPATGVTAGVGALATPGGRSERVGGALVAGGLVLLGCLLGG